MGRLDSRLAEHLVAELRGGRKVDIRASSRRCSNLVTLSALCHPNQYVGDENDSEA